MQLDGKSGCIKSGRVLIFIAPHVRGLLPLHVTLEAVGHA